MDSAKTAPRLYDNLLLRFGASYIRDLTVVCFPTSYLNITLFQQSSSSTGRLLANLPPFSTISVVNYYSHCVASGALYDPHRMYYAWIPPNTAHFSSVELLIQATI